MGVEGAGEEEGRRADGVADWLEKEGKEEEKELAVAAVVVQQMREAVWRETGCTCSSGIAHNKVSAIILFVVDLPCHDCSTDVGQISCWNKQAKRADNFTIFQCTYHLLNYSH